jgi:hypothetical protein
MLRGVSREQIREVFQNRHPGREESQAEIWNFLLVTAMKNTNIQY